jgi:hypothetical protein
MQQLSRKIGCRKKTSWILATSNGFTALSQEAPSVSTVHARRRLNPPDFLSENPRAIYECLDLGPIVKGVIAPLRGVHCRRLCDCLRNETCDLNLRQCELKKNRGNLFGP